MKKVTNILVYIYIATLPVSDVLWNFIAVDFTLTGIGTISVIDVMRLALLFALFSLPAVKKSKESFLLYYLVLFVFLLFIYFRFQLLITDQAGLFDFFKFLFKHFIRYLPLVMILKIMPSSKFQIRSLKNTVLTSSIIIFISVVFRSYFESILGISYQLYEISEIGIQRQVGFFAFGGANAMAACQVIIVSFFIYISIKENNPKSIYLLISFSIAVLTVALVASRGSLFALSIVTLFAIFYHRARFKNLFGYLFALSFVLFILLSVKPDLFEAVVFRLIESETADRDIDFASGEGRLFSYYYYYQFLLNHRGILLFGDIEQSFKLGTQTIHNGYLQMVQYGGIIAFVIFFLLNYKLVLQMLRHKSFIIYVPYFITTSVNSDFTNIYFVAVLQWIVLSYKNFNSK